MQLWNARVWRIGFESKLTYRWASQPLSISNTYSINYIYSIPLIHILPCQYECIFWFLSKLCCNAYYAIINDQMTSVLITREICRNVCYPIKNVARGLGKQLVTPKRPVIHQNAQLPWFLFEPWPVLGGGNQQEKEKTWCSTWLSHRFVYSVDFRDLNYKVDALL